MLSLNMKHNKLFVEEFQKKYLQNLIDARDRVINNGIKVVLKKKNKKLYVSTANRKFLQKRLTDKALKKLISLTPKQQRKVISLGEELSSYPPP